MRRTLGRSGIEVGAVGMGTWAIGGEMASGSQPLGWGGVDDDESTRAIRRAYELGVTLFDTADVYGVGHAERILGAALAPVRDDVVIATKWGNTYDEGTRQLTGEDGTPEYLRWAVRQSLRRLGTDRVDLYQLHFGGLPPTQAEDLVDALEGLVGEGSVRWYGWSTDDPANVDIFAKGPHCAAVQHELNIFSDAPDVLARCDGYDLASLNRSPLAMGLLSDAVTADSRYPADTVRGRQPAWLVWFRDGRPVPEFLARRDAVREILRSGGRTLAQGALAWCWGRSPRTVPLPGCRTVAQVEENAGAMAYGPLAPDQMHEIDAILSGGTTPR
jgi:aryl-alcohol dehydrogenase-like predicted oxidoreductase